VTTNICTHSGCPLGFEQGEAVCPCHGSRFALDGTVTNPPAKAPLRTFVSRYDAGKGELLIDYRAGDTDFPSVVDGKIFFPFAQFSELRTPGGVVQGVPEGYGQLLFVFALEDGTYAAVDGICTHQSCPVEYNESVQLLVCPCHDSHFQKTGDVTQGPATRPLIKYTATPDASGVTVEV
jgi:cytochrome b6-f complex iron-sulfur subunit